MKKKGMTVSSPYPYVNAYSFPFLGCSKSGLHYLDKGLMKPLSHEELGWERFPNTAGSGSKHLHEGEMVCDDSNN